MAKDYTTRTLREIVRIVAGRFLGMVVIFAIVVGSVAIATVLSPKWYRSEAKIRAWTERMGDPADSGASLHDRVSLFVIAQREVLMGDAVISSALMRLEDRPIQPSSADNPAMPWYDAQTVETYAADHAKYLQQVRKRIRLETPGGPEATFTPITTVTVDWPEQREEARKLGLDPRKRAAEGAHKLAKYLVEAYLKRHASLESEQTRARADFLSQERLRRAETDMDQARASLTKFIQESVGADLPLMVAMGSNGSGTPSGTASLTTQFQGEINKIEADLADLASLKGAVDKELAKGDPSMAVVPDAVTAANPLLMKLQDKILQLKLTINNLQPRFTEDYRDLRDAKAELASALRDLQTELQKQSQRLQQQIDSQQARRETLAAKVAEDRQRVGTLASKAAKYQELQRKVDMAETIFQEAKTQYLSAETSEKLAGRKESFLVTMLGQPTRPDPSLPRTPILWLNLLVAVTAGLVLALVYAFLADHYDHSLKSIDEVERYLGLTVLASVPKLGRGVIQIQ